jgi:hypothetical protein
MEQETITLKNIIFIHSFPEEGAQNTILITWGNTRGSQVAEGMRGQHRQELVCCFPWERMDKAE